MATYNKQLKVTNMDNYLDQIDKSTGPYTVVKFKCRAANCYMKNGSKKNLKKAANLIISKSGNTLETIVNTNILVKKSDKNIFITENKKNYLHILAEKMKSDIIHHNNFIGGRYSVLSEVGMVPA